MKRKRTTEEWKAHVYNYQESGKSLSAYSRENDIRPTTFIYWIKKVNKSDPQRARGLVRISKATDINHKMKLIYNQTTVEFPAEISIEKMSNLITAIKEIY